MRVFLNGSIYHSTETPIVIEFDENERQLFNGKEKFVFAPLDCSAKERERLMSNSFEVLEYEEIKSNEVINNLRKKLYKEHEARQSQIRKYIKLQEELRWEE